MTGLCYCFTSISNQPSSSVSIQKVGDEATESQDRSLLERIIEALHIELLFVRHRIAVKLVNLGQETVEQKKSAKKQKVSGNLFPNNRAWLSSYLELARLKGGHCQGYFATVVFVKTAQTFDKEPLLKHDMFL